MKLKMKLKRVPPLLCAWTTVTSASCFATVLSDVAAVELTWSFRDAQGCDEANVAHVSVLATNDDGTTTARWFRCDAPKAELVVPAGPARLILEGVDAHGTTRYTADAEIDAAQRQKLVVGEVVLAPLRTGDLVVEVALARLCAENIVPATVLVVIDGELAAPPIREPLCSVDAQIVVNDLDPDTYLLEVIGLSDDGDTLFHERVEAVVTAGMVSVVGVDIGPGDAMPAAPEQDETYDDGVLPFDATRATGATRPTSL